MDGRTMKPAYTISSPRALGSGELKMYSFTDGLTVFDGFLDTGWPKTI